MAEYPYIPLFVEPYLSKTRHLSTEQHGAYFLLLLEAWQRKNCALPDDDALLARLAGVTPQKWKKLKPIVMEFFKKDEGFWFNKRLTEEREFVAKNIAQKSGAGKASARKRKEKKLTAVATAEQREANGEPNETPTAEQHSTHYTKPLKSPFDFSSETHRSIFIRLEELIEAQWPNAPPNFDSRLLADTAKDFAEQGATVDIVNATIPPILSRIAEQRSTPPADLTAFRGEIVQAVRHWVQAKRDRWKPEWGAEPPADVMARFEIPALYRLPGESAASRPKPKYAPGEEFGEIPPYLKREATNA